MDILQNMKRKSRSYFQLTPYYFFTDKLATETTIVCVFVCLVTSDSLVTPWTVAHQTPLSMESSRQEYYSGFHFLLWGSFWPRDWTCISCVLLNCKRILYPPSHQGMPSSRVQNGGPERHCGYPISLRQPRRMALEGNVFSIRMAVPVTLQHPAWSQPGRLHSKDFNLREMV